MMKQNSPKFFDENQSADVVISRNTDADDERLKHVMAVITRHLHEAVKELEPTPDEWMQAIQFLTKTGHMCDEWRQEFILLSDVLGVSMLVESISARRPDGATENTVLGPFHVPGAPELENGENICLDEKGEALVVRGTVSDINGDPITGARLDVWQANDDGFYDVQQKGLQPDFNLRGIFKSDADGCYWFRSVKPKHYPIPADGPVGDLLNALGRQPTRPAHLHFIVSADGFETVTTHIFDPKDPYLDRDPVFGVKQSLLKDFVYVENNERASKYNLNAPFWEVEFDAVLSPSQNPK